MVMRLPAPEECQHDMFLFNLRDNDHRQFLSQKWGANQRFQSRRRIVLAAELLSQRLPRSGATVADIACGTADFGLLMAEKGFPVDLIDNEPKFFDYIRLKKTTGTVNFVQSDINTLSLDKKFSAIFFGEALEHMAEPSQTLKVLREHLPKGGLLCLTTPNGDFANCYTENWEQVKDQKDRNKRLANTIGNHVCEFTKKELKTLVQEAGFCILQHKTIVSDLVARRHAVRWLLPEKLVWMLDESWSKRETTSGKDLGKLQLLLAQRVG